MRIAVAVLTPLFSCTAHALNSEFGGTVVRELEQNVGTHANFFTRLSWCWTEACLSFARISHGGGLFGLRREVAIKGFNFQFLEYKYR